MSIPQQQLCRAAGPADSNGLQLLPLRAALALAKSFHLNLYQVEEEALQFGLLPARFARNHKSISIDEQLRLHRATVAITGLGGLGGAVLECLARSGVGRVILIDGDRFEESNLNRQLLATIDTLGCWKVEIAADRARAVNPAIRTIRHRTRITSDNADRLLEKAEYVADCLDTPEDRTLLADHCCRSGLTFVSAAICGDAGQVVTSLAGSSTAAAEFYRGKKANTAPGNQAVPAMLLAALQSAELLRLILGRAVHCSDSLTFCDLDSWEYQQIPLV